MISRSVRRASVLGFLALSLFGCDSKEASPVAAPEKVNEAKPQAPTSSSADAKAETKPEASAQDKPEAKLEEKAEKAEAKVDDKPPNKGDKGDKGEAKADDKAKSDPKASAAKGAGDSLVPAPASGILSKTAADKLVKPGSPPLVHLLDPGAEPRSIITYALTPGKAKPFRMGMDLEMAMKSAGLNLPPTKVPHMGMLFDFTTGDPKAKDWPIEGKVTDITVDANGVQDAQVAKALREQLDTMKGFGMTYFVDQQGRVHDLKLSWPDAMPAQAQQMMAGMSQSLESMTSPLPAEAVGLGAKWEVIGRAAANGADLLQVSTFSLKEQKADVLKLDVAVRQLAANDEVAPPGMPPSAKAKIVSFASSGTGKTVVHLKDVAPTDGSIGMTTSMSLEISMTMDGTTKKEKTSIDTKTKVTYARPAK